MASTVYGLAESMKPEIIQQVTLLIKHDAMRVHALLEV